MSVEFNKVDIDEKETQMISNIEINTDNLHDLEVRIEENAKKAKNLFLNIQKLQNCYDVTYTDMSIEDVGYVVDRIDTIKGQRNEDLSHLCNIVRKYLDSITAISSNKTIHKENIQHVLNEMYETVNEICGFQLKEQDEIGSLYRTQLDEIVTVRSKLQGDIEMNCCKEIKKVFNIIKQYHDVICEQLDKYTTLLKQMGKKSNNYSYVLNKIHEYRLLYKRLMLYVKHYKIINKESIIACENKDSNLDHLYLYLKDVETYLNIRVDAMYSFLMNAK